MEAILCGIEIMIDDDDAHILTDFRWWKRYRNGTYFIAKSGTPGNEIFISLHRTLISAPNGMQVDHINGNTLDNRKCNLRLCTPDQNQMNKKMRRDCSSGVKGVYFNKKSGRYEARIRYGKKRLFIGSFIKIEDAGKAYIDASRKHHGSFSRT